MRVPWNLNETLTTTYRASQIIILSLGASDDGEGSTEQLHSTTFKEI